MSVVSAAFGESPAMSSTIEVKIAAKRIASNGAASASLSRRRSNRAAIGLALLPRTRAGHRRAELLRRDVCWVHLRNQAATQDDLQSVGYADQLVEIR